MNQIGIGYHRRSICSRVSVHAKMFNYSTAEYRVLVFGNVSLFVTDAFFGGSNS